ncbi:fungal-specific transcription factor domain-containing protein [Hypoxylon crocopeplum]|nr:fungal-specific transcription factor domain-containing protein [Hypoxylon crocopeplum]
MADGTLRARTLALAARACNNCRKRKSRCSGANNENGACYYCIRTRKDCVFEEPVNRTPLKRENLDAAELRCSQLEALLRSLNPDLNIETALSTLSGSTSAELRSDQVQASGTEADPGGEVEGVRYEWHEDTSLHLAAAGPQESPDLGNQEDGMATFSTSESGYLGSSSGSSLLQEIGAMLPRMAAEGNSAQCSPNQMSPSNGGEIDRTDLASTAVTSLLIDAYFLFYNTSYPIVHEKTFREKAAGDWRHTKRRSTWSIVYYMVLAIGHWVSATDHTSQFHCPYYSAARSRLSVTMLESGTIETIQAFLLIGNYLQKRDRPNTGYNLIGIAYRIAFGLGLHREVPNTTDRMIHERRRQLFWIIYCFDNGFSITTGRPPTAADGFFDIRLPRNVEDKDCTITCGVVREVDHPTPYSAIIAQARLAKIASALYCEFLMAKTAGARIEYQVAEAIDGNLCAWKNALPDYFTSPDVPSWFLGPRSVVLWKQQNLRTLIWRGSKINHPFLPFKLDAEHRCVELAMQSIHDIASFCEEFESILHLGLSWYATYFLFQATLILEASCIGRENREQAWFDPLAWEMSISRSRSCLDRLAKKNSSATRCLIIIDSIQINLSSLATSQPNQHVEATRLQTEHASGPIQNQASVLDEILTEFPTNNSTYWDGFDFDNGNFNGDSTIRMLIDQTPLDFLDDVHRDGLFNTSSDMRCS